MLKHKKWFIGAMGVIGILFLSIVIYISYISNFCSTKALLIVDFKPKVDVIEARKYLQGYEKYLQGEIKRLEPHPQKAIVVSLKLNTCRGFIFWAKLKANKFKKNPIVDLISFIYNIK